jgi:serine/threonine protein kinase
MLQFFRYSLVILLLSTHLVLYASFPHLKEYKIYSECGSGGNGKVYKATDRDGKIVAIKQFFKSAGAHTANHEYQVGKMLDHRHIMKIYKKIEQEDHNGSINYFLIMEFVNGTTLGRSSFGTIPREKALQNAIHFLDVLKHAYHQKLFHRSLYLENIMYDEKNNIKFIDMGSFVSDDDRHTFKEYGKMIRDVVGLILSHGGFSSEKIASIKQKMSERLRSETYINECDRCFNTNSELFIPLIDQFIEILEG